MKECVWSFGSRSIDQWRPEGVALASQPAAQQNTKAANQRFEMCPNPMLRTLSSKKHPKSSGLAIVPQASQMHGSIDSFTKHKSTEASALDPRTICFLLARFKNRARAPNVPSVENLEESARPPARTRRRISRPTLVTIDLIFSTPPKTTQRLIMNC